MTALWLPFTLAATLLQLVRNAAQRGLADTAGPWGATLARFLFGLPFACLFLAGVWLVAPPVAPNPSPAWLGAAAIGGAAQICATAALLAAMRASTFALGSTFQHLSLPLAALFGALVLSDHLAWTGWAGIAAATAGLALASWPKAGVRLAPGAFKATAFGLAAGAAFAISANAYRFCGQTLDPASPFFSSTATLVAVQAMQSAGLGAILLAADRKALSALRADLKASLLAGFAGAAASAFWFAALALAPAALVRAAAALVEAPLAMVVGKVRFREDVGLERGLGAALIVAGVVALVAGAR